MSRTPPCSGVLVAMALLVTLDATLAQRQRQQLTPGQRRGERRRKMRWPGGGWGGVDRSWMKEEGIEVEGERVS